MTVPERATFARNVIFDFLFSVCREKIEWNYFSELEPPWGAAAFSNDFYNARKSGNVDRNLKIKYHAKSMPSFRKVSAPDQMICRVVNIAQYWRGSTFTTSKLINLRTKFRWKIAKLVKQRASIKVSWKMTSLKGIHNKVLPSEYT